MLDHCADALKNSPLKNTPLQSMTILESLNYSRDKFKKKLRGNINHYNIPDVEIDTFINNISNKVHQTIFED
jgi:hypothetical protein